MSGQKAMKAPGALQVNRRPIVLAFLIGVVIWCLVDLVYVAWGVDWIRQSDSRDYWRIATDLAAFDSAITIGFPLIWRGLHLVFPWVSPNILGLPIADGLLGTIVVGARGSARDLMQGVIVLGHWLMALFLLLSRIWMRYLFTLALIVTVLLLGLIQPASEIWAMVTYTTYLSIPLILYLQQKQERWLANNAL